MKVEFLTWLAGMMEKTDLARAIEVSSKQQPKGTVVCTIENDGIRRLLGVSHDIAAAGLKAVDDFQRQHPGDADAETHKNFAAEQRWLLQQADIVNSMFWHALAHEYPQTRDKDNLVIGPNWQVFEEPKQERRRPMGISILTISGSLDDIFGVR